MKKSRTYIASPPGETIKEQLEYRGMTQKEFAERMALSEKHVSNLLNGDVQLTPDVALRLEMVLGVPANFWNSLEATYREKLAKVEAENAMDEDKELAMKFPYNEMAKFAWVSQARKQEERVIELRKHFEVSQLTLVGKDELLPRIACRRLGITENADFALLAWAQKAKLEARMIDTSPINLKNLDNNIKEIKRMSRMEPNEFCEKLIHLLSTCGIALVFLPHIGGSFLHGATFYDMKKIVLGLTVRGKYADKFWFSLFHEIGHILLGHINKSEGTNDEDEKAADDFAKEALIPIMKYAAFTRKGQFTRQNIETFAEKLSVAPGIVVGRLQKDNYIPFSWHNDLKKQYCIVE